MSAPTIVLVLAKSPRAGQVKTRLSPPATPAQAARIAAACLLDTLDAVRALPDAQPVLALSGTLDGAEHGDDLAAAMTGLPVVAQRGSSLAERIVAAHADVAEQFPAAQTVQLGMDTPQVTPALLARCVRVLEGPGTDALLGHAPDGGWWLLGLRDPLAARGIAQVPMSRPDTGVHTARALRSYGLRLRSAPELSDVDTFADAQRVAADCPGGRFARAVGELR